MTTTRDLEKEIAAARIIREQVAALTGDDPDFIRDAIEDADAAAWRPIEEAPKDGTKVNIWRENYTVLEAFWDVYLQKWLLDLGSHIGAIHYEPTHFRPLPTPPKEPPK